MVLNIGHGDGVLSSIAEVLVLQTSECLWKRVLLVISQRAGTFQLQEGVVVRTVVSPEKGTD